MTGERVGVDRGAARRRKARPGGGARGGLGGSRRLRQHLQPHDGGDSGEVADGRASDLRAGALEQESIDRLGQSLTDNQQDKKKNLQRGLRSIGGAVGSTRLSIGDRLGGGPTSTWEELSGLVPSRSEIDWGRPRNRLGVSCSGLVPIDLDRLGELSDRLLVIDRDRLGGAVGSTAYRSRSIGGSCRTWCLSIEIDWGELSGLVLYRSEIDWGEGLGVCVLSSASEQSGGRPDGY